LKNLFPIASCDLDKLANYYYDADQSGVIDAGDVTCVQYFADNKSVMPGCPSTGMTYYDVNYDCPGLFGIGCITNADVALLNDYINPATRAAALGSMPYLPHAQARRKCGSPPPVCDADAIARRLLNVYTIDSVLNNFDEQCTHSYIINPFQPELYSSNCAGVNNLMYEYDVNHLCKPNSCVTTWDKTQLNDYISGAKTAMDLKSIQDIMGIHCSGPPNTAPTLVVPVNGSQYYWMANSNGGQFVIRTNDPDGDDMTYSVTPLPSGAGYSPSNFIPGPDTDLKTTFTWFPINPSQVGDYNLVVKANDGTTDSNVANVLGRVALYSEIFTDPQAGGAPATYTISGGAYVFDKQAQVGQVYGLDLELPWLPTITMWGFSTRNTGPCPLPSGAPAPQWNESLTNEAKARFSWTPDTYPPGGVQDVCVSWNMESGNGWIVSGLYHRKFRFNFVPEMTLQSDPAETTQYAYIGEIKTIDFTTDNGVSPFTYADINTTSTPGGAPPLGDSWKDADTWGFTPIAGQLGFTYSVTFQSTDSATPTPETDDKIIKITVTDLTMTSPGPTELNHTADVGDDFRLNLAATGGTAPYTFSFISNPSSGDMQILTSPDQFQFNPAAAGTYNIALRVTDNVGAYYDRAITLTVGPAGDCPDGQYLAGPGLCCLLSEVQDPNNSTQCIASSGTIEIVDKNDFTDDTNNNDFLSICRMNETNRQSLILQGVNANVNDMEFESTSNDYLLWSCRNLNRNYKWYKHYIINPTDFNPSILVEP
ncbi:hypothetical protein N9N67_04965, partial [Bacteriovoracaceae bacterium]|nr:hypothetical protein [Bacteriovoracaceae bacterium]